MAQVVECLLCHEFKLLPKKTNIKRYIERVSCGEYLMPMVPGHKVGRLYIRGQHRWEWRVYVCSPVWTVNSSFFKKRGSFWPTYFLTLEQKECPNVFVLFFNMRDFIVIIPYMHTVYLEHIPLLHYVPISPLLLPPSFKQCLLGFVMLSSYTYMLHTSIVFTPQHPLLPLSPLPLTPPR
jgi:hypothetical protein